MPEVARIQFHVDSMVVLKWIAGASKQYKIAVANLVSQIHEETRVDQWALGGQQLPRDFTIAADEPPELLGDATAPFPAGLEGQSRRWCLW